MSDLFFKGSRESVLLPLVAECDTETGATYRVNFKARYKTPSQDERKELAEGCASGVISDDDVVERLVIGWQDVKDSNDEAVPFSIDALQAIMQVVPYRTALVDGGIRMVFGKKAVEVMRQKNSRRPAAAG